jgi:hypothetical protein
MAGSFDSGTFSTLLELVIISQNNLGAYSQRLASHGHKVCLGIIHLFIEKKPDQSKGQTRRKRSR